MERFLRVRRESDIVVESYEALGSETDFDTIESRPSETLDYQVRLTAEFASREGSFLGLAYSAF